MNSHISSQNSLNLELGMDLLTYLMDMGKYSKN